MTFFDALGPGGLPIVLDYLNPTDSANLAPVNKHYEHQIRQHTEKRLEQLFHVMYTSYNRFYAARHKNIIDEYSSYIYSRDITSNSKYVVTKIFFDEFVKGELKKRVPRLIRSICQCTI